MSGQWTKVQASSIAAPCSASTLILRYLGISFGPNWDVSGGVCHCLLWNFGDQGCLCCVCVIVIAFAFHYCKFGHHLLSRVPRRSTLQFLPRHLQHGNTANTASHVPKCPTFLNKNIRLPCSAPTYHSQSHLSASATINSISHPPDLVILHPHDTHPSGNSVHHHHHHHRQHDSPKVHNAWRA